MRKKVLLILAGILLTLNFNLLIKAEETDNVKDHNHEVIETFNADDHHSHGTLYANFIPEQILNPDGSDYEAPDATEEYVGFYTAETFIEELDSILHLALKIEADGLLNLAYYYEDQAENTGVRFYANEDNQIEKRDAIYQDLTLLTAGLKEGENGLIAGLIGETIAPVVLLNERGEPDKLYAFMSMAYGLRDSYVNPRVYQSVGLYLRDESVAVDINYLIGLESEEERVAVFEKQATEESREEAKLLERPTFEILQDNFDYYLIDHNDFKFDFDTANEFVQEVLAMQLQTNASFPPSTTVELLDPDNVVDSTTVPSKDYLYIMAINETILYAYDNNNLYMATDFVEENRVYSEIQWLTN